MIGLISPSKFQSTLPARGATLISAAFGAQLVFQSTLPARGATTSGNVSKEYVDISIHAPRTGSDNLRQCLYPPEAHFNPRSPHGERPQLYCEIFDHTNFNPRSPHGERLRPNRYPRAPLYFNPRSPHGERPGAPRRNGGKKVFQSTLPARGATRTRRRNGETPPISIHAPRTGSDAGRPGGKKEQPYFNPRSPHGERPA